MSFLIYNVFYFPERVAIGSLEHITPIIIASIFCVSFIRISRHKFSKKQQIKAIQIFAIIISSIVITFHIHKLSTGTYNISLDLPLFLCSFLGIVIPLFAYYRKYWMYEILFFWIVAGTFQGVITPDIPLGFPTFDYFRYWTVHLGLLIVMFYFTFVLNMRPTLNSVFKSFLALQVYVVVLIGINYILKANYLYLNKKPDSASLLDYFGDWPYYILVVQIIIIPYFLLIYLPFYLTKK